MAGSQDELISRLHQAGAILFGDFTLKSGKKSNIYIDLRSLISSPALLAHIADLMWSSVQEQPFDLLCGVPYTALPIASYLSCKHLMPMLIKRKEKKDYGTKQLVEGKKQAGQKVLVIEDVIRYVDDGLDKQLMVG